MTKTYVPQTAAETFSRIVEKPSQPWVAVGDFLDDWRRTPACERGPLAAAAPDGALAADPEIRRWFAFLAAAVEWLSYGDGLAFPEWTSRRETFLREPWFLYPGDALRPWQLATTPTPFRMRNIFGGDRILDRVRPSPSSG